jgi:NAD(P)-dependent dehydrogenase (short-subunit alcohol dehydrogenase family)
MCRALWPCNDSSIFTFISIFGSSLDLSSSPIDFYLLTLRCYKSTMAPSAIADLVLPEVVPESKETQANQTVPQLFSLAGGTTLITGGGRGLGLELAHAVIEAGGCVACIDILPHEVVETDMATLQKRASLFGLRASYDRVDITNEPELEAVYGSIIATAKDQGKPLQGIIACAGIQQITKAMDYTVPDFNRMFNVNVTGAFLTAKHAAREFISSGTKGSIVMIASMSGQATNRSLNCSAYNSSKAAVHQLSRSLAAEWGPKHGIRVNTLSPGYIRTAMTDKLLQDEPEIHEIWMRGAMLDRLGAPEDFKAPAVFLLAPGSAWMTGADIRVDGGHLAWA